MRLGLFVDVEYWRDAEGLSTDQPVLRFLLGLADHVDELVLLGRVTPGSGRRPYAIPADIRLVELPYYRSVWDVRAIARALPGARRAASKALPGLDVLWVLGPSPVSLSLALLARRRGTRLALGVRQDYPAYVRHRLPGARWLPALLAAHLLERGYRRLSRSVPTAAVGAELAGRYGSRTTPALSLTILPLRNEDLDEGRGERSAGAFELLWVGRLDREKGPRTALDAMRLLGSGRSRTYRLTIAGDGPLEPELRRESELRGDPIRFLGHVPHGPELFRRFREADALVHVSLTEGLPQAVLEAMAFGTPVIATDVGGVRAALADGADGLLVPPADPRALADAVRRLAADPALAAELARRGRAAASPHTMEHELPRLVAFLEGGRPPGPTASPGTPPGRPLRVLALIDRVAASGGAERLVTELAKRADRERFVPYVCATRSGSDPEVLRELEDAGVRVIDLARSRTLDARAWRRFVSMLRSERIDVLHAHSFGSNAWGSTLGRLARVPVVIAHEHTWSFQGDLSRRLVDRFVIARLADVFLAVSAEDRRKMIELERIDPARIQVLPNGIPAPALTGTDVRAELGIAADAPLLGSVGNLRPQKAYDVLVRAAAILRREHGDLRVVIAGEGSERESLGALIAELGLGETVLLLGERRDALDVVDAADVAVNTSSFEGSPLSVLEYMALGKPIVASRVGGTPDLIEDRVHGLLVEPGDPTVLAAAVSELLRDGTLARRLGEAAAQRQRHEFTFDAMVQRLEHLYLELAARSGLL